MWPLLKIKIFWGWFIFLTLLFPACWHYTYFVFFLSKVVFLIEAEKETIKFSLLTLKINGNGRKRTTIWVKMVSCLLNFVAKKILLFYPQNLKCMNILSTTSITFPLSQYIQNQSYKNTCVTAISSFITNKLPQMGKHPTLS